jgi:hypothetical protein
MSDTPETTPAPDDTDPWLINRGRVAARVRMPDLFGILATFGSVPSPQLAAVLDLLVADGVELLSPDPAKVYVRKRDQIRGMYALAALILVEPRLVLSGDPGPGEIGPRDLSFEDLEGLYYSYFRNGYRLPSAPDPHPDAAGGAAEPSAPGGDLPPPTE